MHILEKRIYVVYIHYRSGIWQDLFLSDGGLTFIILLLVFVERLPPIPGGRTNEGVRPYTSIARCQVFFGAALC
jgi:hypothetical protein